MPETSETYRTTDFYLAAFLRAAGYAFETPEFDGRGRATFIFHDVKQEDVVAFYNASETHRVSAQGLIEAIQRTRSIVYNVPHS